MVYNSSAEFPLSCSDACTKFVLAVWAVVWDMGCYIALPAIARLLWHNMASSSLKILPLIRALLVQILLAHSQHLLSHPFHRYGIPLLDLPLAQTNQPLLFPSLHFPQQTSQHCKRVKQLHFTTILPPQMSLLLFTPQRQPRQLWLRHQPYCIDLPPPINQTFPHSNQTPPVIMINLLLSPCLHPPAKLCPRAQQLHQSQHTTLHTQAYSPFGKIASLAVISASFIKSLKHEKSLVVEHLSGRRQDCQHLSHSLGGNQPMLATPFCLFFPFISS